MHSDDNRRARVPDSHIIRRYDAEGKSPTEIAGLLGFTAQSVRNVLSGFVEKGQLVDVGLQILEVVQHANSIDQKWPTAELLNIFRFSTRGRGAIERYFKCSAVTELSLRDVFEVFVCDKSTQSPGVVITPYLDFRNGGETGFWDAVDRITKLDMGECANAIWRLKLKRLEQANRIKGPGRHAWSKPVRRIKVA